jgi:demethylmenaquinone methyltransferase/2-methoxy-6-polyprenyl-1,4-benzoquinol methylase
LTSDLGGLPTGTEKAHAVRSMFDKIAPRYDLVNRVMTFGMDLSWRRRAVAALGLPPGSLVLDVACGTGDFCRELEEKGYRPTGFDVSLGMLSRARTGAPLVQADALRLPVRAAAADGVTCGFALRNLTDLTALFDELARTSRSGGRVAILEVARPESRLLRAGHHVYFDKVVPLIGGLLSDRAAYSYLPKSAAYLPPTPELLALLQQAGFIDTTVALMGAGAVQLITATRA